ncbi:MAG: integrase catalytic domain-containing protein [Chitinophagaceae bacterium]|nr:integrase catalytic domain-containing protein [Chitinophagaceae bacterium]
MIWIYQKQRLEKVRDLFILACYTGLRFSDLIQVRPENIINNGSQIKVKTEKTGELVIIPIHKFVREILVKYKGSLPASISNQKMNEYLKEIAELAKIKETVKISITRGGETDNMINKKFELVTTHTARRSFCHECLSDGRSFYFDNEDNRPQNRKVIYEVYSY